MKYVSGMEDKPQIKSGFWLTMFYIDSAGYINFDFAPTADLHWDTETEANERSTALLESGGVKTEVVKVGF